MTTADIDHRPYDIILYGATSFVGQLVAEYIFDRYGVGGTPRWALAGRNRVKLAEVRDRLGIGLGSLPLVLADATVTENMDRLAEQARLIISTVGPYARYGSELVAACARHGTDYCDLSGEVPWMRRMIDAHQATARESGARIVHCCGFDSIPSDLGVLFLQESLREAGEAPCTHIKFRLEDAQGGMSGGTVASLMGVLEESGDNPAVAKLLKDPYALNPEGERHGPDKPDLSGIAHDDDLDAWVAPFVMAGINTRIVRRSHALRGYPWGREFRYDEATVTGPGRGGWLQALRMAIGQGTMLSGAKLRPLRWTLMNYILPKPGDGPSAEQRRKGYFKIRLIGKRADGSTVQARVEGEGDPGYGATSRMLGEAAVCLVMDIHRDRVPGGFWTPATALGMTLVRRLHDHGWIKFHRD